MDPEDRVATHTSLKGRYWSQLYRMEKPSTPNVMSFITQAFGLALHPSIGTGSFIGIEQMLLAFFPKTVITPSPLKVSDVRPTRLLLLGAYSYTDRAVLLSSHCRTHVMFNFIHYPPNMYN